MKKNSFDPSNRWVKKVNFVKKLFLVLLILQLFPVQIFADTNQDPPKLISLSFDNEKLSETLVKIEQASGYKLVFNYEDVESYRITGNFVKKQVEDVLNTILKDKPFTYKVQSQKGIVVIIPKSNNQIVYGKVTDSDKNPLLGVDITIKNKSRGTITDADGNFQIKASEKDILVVKFISYKTKEVQITDDHVYNIQLASNVNTLDEAMVIAYGKSSKRLSTGDVSTISSKEIEEQPVTNILQALSGRVPGLLMTENSGNPGGAVSVQIRGVGSLLSGTNPLYIVDGVPYLSDAIYKSGGNTSSSLAPSYGSSPLNALNPSDIESISVLKDADATALYGSKGSNGVILITTKKGTAGKTKVDVSISQGFSETSDIHRVKPLSLDQYLEIRRAAYANSGTTPTAYNAPDLVSWDTTGKQNVDFMKLLVGKTAQVTDASTSFSGGSQQTVFLLSGTWHKETSVIPGNNYYNRGAIHFSIEHTSLNKKFTATISNSMIWDAGNNAGQVFQQSDLAGYAFGLAPNHPLYDSTGNLYWYSSNTSNSRFDNPLSYKYSTYTTKNNNLLGNILLKYTPIPGLNIRLNTSYNKITANSKNLHYSKGINPYSGVLPSAFFQENTSETLNIEPQIDYTQNIWKGAFNILGGASFQKNDYNQPYYIVGTNYSSDALLNNPQAAGSYYLYTFSSQYKYQSFFGRINYNIKQKYILNVNYRWDASSKFGKNNRYGSFASVGGAWIFSQENLIKKNFPILSYGKLRANYGSTGNDQVGNYEYMDTYSTSYYSYNNVSSIVPSKIANPDLKWEVNKKLEIGLDLGFFKDRILLSGSWFYNRTINPIVSAPLTTVTGFSSYTANLDAVIRQEGEEFTLTTKNIQKPNFNWVTDFNITFADSKLTSFKDFENSSYYNTMVLGKSTSAIYGFKYLGIDPATSLPKFLDANNNGTNSYTETYPAANKGAGDYVYLGKSNPDFYGGLNNSFSYKGFQLDIFVQFVGHTMKKSIMASASVPGYNASNMYNGVYDLFKETNGKIATRTFNYTDGSPYVSFVKYLQSDAVLSDAAYARLKNVSLSYTFGQNLISRLKISSAQLYLRAQNLYTLTKYKGLDPETGSSFVPPLRTITFGVKFSL